jgi:hypothetical protein
LRALGKPHPRYAGPHSISRRLRAKQKTRRQRTGRGASAFRLRSMGWAHSDRRRRARWIVRGTVNMEKCTKLRSFVAGKRDRVA